MVRPPRQKEAEQHTPQNTARAIQRINAPGGFPMSLPNQNAAGQRQEKASPQTIRQKHEQAGDYRLDHPDLVSRKKTQPCNPRRATSSTSGR